MIDSTTGHLLLEAYPRTERSLHVGGGVTVQASSLYGSRASSLASSLGIVEAAALKYLPRLFIPVRSFAVLL